MPPSVIATVRGMAQATTSAERQSISIGDTLDQMQARIQASPLSVKSYSLQPTAYSRRIKSRLLR